MNELQNKLVEEFEDAAYAHGYMEGHRHDKLVAQIYWTRKARDWTQDDLAAKAGMKQTQISKIESGEFDSLTMKTLGRLARALDVNLRLEFEPFSHAIYDVCHLNREAMEIPKRAVSLLKLKSSTKSLNRVHGGEPIFINATTTGAPSMTATSVMTETAVPAVAFTAMA